LPNLALKQGYPHSFKREEAFSLQKCLVNIRSVEQPVIAPKRSFNTLAKSFSLMIKKFLQAIHFRVVQAMLSLLLPEALCERHAMRTASSAYPY
jgi:hypothetical protein